MFCFPPVEIENRRALSDICLDFLGRFLHFYRKKVGKSVRLNVFIAIFAATYQKNNEGTETMNGYYFYTGTSMCTMTLRG